MRLDDATRAQVDAARPDASTWLSANAGSGKTRVLTDRVARLLLSGVEPQQILCLTYTKAAASEMQNRLFKRLGQWSMAEDAQLRNAMKTLGVSDDLDPATLRHARTLFARAIETPGGLKIQTIHSFCAALLRRFPLEAGVSPQFTEIEDRAADLLRAEIVDNMAAGPDAPLIAGIARHYTGEDLGSLTRQIVGMRERFTAPKTLADLLTALGQRVDLEEAGLKEQAFLGEEEALIQRIVPHLHAKGGNDGKAALQLERIRDFDLSALPVLEKLFLTGASAASPFSAKTDSFPTKPTRALIADDLPALNAFMQRVEDTREARLCLATAEKSHALHRFARAFLDRYEQAKQLRGWLDFDDLILKARALLTDKAVAAWVLYRIDGGIDHILVDEAQDTSPRQWDVIERLTDEFHSGFGSKPDVDRTLFVVGDKKQSIYSFQGADPTKFDEKAAGFANKITGVGKSFQERSLEYSFRSSNAILRLVDTVFDQRRRPGFNKDTLHRAFKEALPGRVDLWPPVEPAEKDPDRHWTDPLDRRSMRHHDVVLAEKIAAQIRELVEGEHYIPEDTNEPGTFARRRIRPGDFLILVQRRSALFSEIIRACKAAGLPIAGADRLKVGAELAVRDLAALLSFLATPDDSLSLAVALKSPLFGWSEQQLFSLSHYRTQPHLWQALRDQEAVHPKTLAILHDLRAQVDFLRPYDLIERVLTRHGGRAKLLGRLGAEAEDGINAMLVQALAYERNDVPSLTGFIEWMQTDDLEIKRQIDAASNQIRVMTVHGAKGLEAPIVILPDTRKPRGDIRDDVIAHQDVPVWKPVADDMPQTLLQTVDDMRKAQEEERLRLLYVAMTRAEKWLIVAAAGDLAKDGSDWYQIISEAMGHTNAVIPAGEDFKRYEEGDWNTLPLSDRIAETSVIPLLDPVFDNPVPPTSTPPVILSPSDLGGAKAISGADGEESDVAMRYGTLVHGLLEKIPQIPAARREAASLDLAASEEHAERAVQEALSILNAPHLNDVFAKDTLAEVPISATLFDHPCHGIIDRLIIEETKITAVDFKTNRTVPADPQACPEGILRQMGAYVEMLSQVYPDHQIQTAVLWTATGDLMPLPHDLVTSALRRAADLDVPDPHS
jgi:ATP-dependent helicase/nuclease subunit A